MKKITHNEIIFIIMFMLFITMIIIIFTISNSPPTGIIQQQEQQSLLQHNVHSNFTCDKNICIFKIDNSYEYCSYIKDTRKNEILKINCYKK